MGVDGICTDYPELVNDSNKKFRPQASSRSNLGDASTFPFPETHNALDPELRGLATAHTDEAVTVATGKVMFNGKTRSSISGVANIDAKNLGGWFERPGAKTAGSQVVMTDQQRLLGALYGDLGSVRDFSVDAVQEAKLLLKVSLSNDGSGLGLGKWRRGGD